MNDQHADILTIAQRAQTLALLWNDADPVRMLSTVCDVLRDLPKCDALQDRVALALIVRRVADAFVHAEPLHQSPLAARLTRSRTSDVHVARTLQIIRREFTAPELNLQGAASRCRVSPAYLSHLLTAETGHGFRTHLRVVRVLHAAEVLANTPLFIEEVADKCGLKSTGTLDTEFHLWFGMTPSEYRRWVT